MFGLFRRDPLLKWLLLGLLFLIALFWTLYFWIGRPMIADLYSGKFESIMGERLDARAENPVSFYYHRAQNLLTTISLLLIAGVVFAFLVIRDRRQISATFQRERRWRATAISESFREQPLNQGRLLAMLALFTVFISLYVWQGSRFLNSPAISEDSLLFEADVRIAADDMTSFRASQYVLPPRHPIFVLLVNPFGSLLNLVLPALTAALVLNGVFGALGVVLAFLIFERWHRNLLTAAALAALYGVTMSQLFSGSLPETYALAACTVLITFGLTIISVQQQRIDFWPWVMAGALALGVTATNVVQTIICFALAASAARERDVTPPLPRVLTYVLTVAAVAIALTLIQKFIYPSVAVYSIAHHRVTLGFVDFSPLLHPLDLLARELKHFALANIVGAIPHEVPWPGTTLPALTYDAPLKFGTWGWIGAATWMLIFAGGVISAAWYQGKDRAVLKAFFACLLFNFLLHTFYGTGVTGRMEFFLYSAHWTFAIIFMTMCALEAKPLYRVGLAALVAILFVNNLGILQHIRDVYARFQ